MAGLARTDELLAALRREGVARRYGAGEALFLEGDIGDRVFVVERGWVAIRITGRDGADVVLALRGPGEILGELSALDGKPRSAEAVAATQVEAAVAPASALRRLVDERHGAALGLLAVTADRLREADRRRHEFATMDTLGRVASRLVELSARFGVPDAVGTRVDLPLAQDQLASWCGASREATVKALRTLRDLGIVTTGRRTVTVLDPARLEQAARGRA